MNYIMKKKSIYIVEDNKDIGFILQYFLSDEGFDVELFETVADFNARLVNKIPDLFLLDVMLPDGDGLDVCSQIKHLSNFKEKPVLVMSAHLPSDFEREESCADSFIPKPFDLFMILKRVNHFLPAA
ncbi:MAG: response regulator transcription factor [Flavobacterium sp.]|nr:MAG: response regulator transcription factor [Flavobacterium sp.]